MAITVLVFAVIRMLDAFTAPIYRLVAFFSSRKQIPTATNPILTTSASVLAEKIRARELTCSQVVSAFVARCKEVNPVLNAIIDERYEDALADAGKADRFLRETRVHVLQLRNEKPLLGIPITVKECCSVKGMKFSLGIKRYENRRAAYNGDAVQLLMEAGAIPIAVTSTPAYSSWIETFNEIIGYTDNPYDSRKSCAGSSGGEAALIASAASVLGLGSDAGGSIRIPAAFCGIYGHKPSNAMVPTGGHATFFSHRQLLDMLTVGPLCRYAADLRLAMRVLSNNRLQMRSSNSIKDNLQRIRVHYLLQYERACFSVNTILKRKISLAVTHLETKHNCIVKKMNLAEFQSIPDITLTHFQKLVALTASEDASSTQFVCTVSTHIPNLTYVIRIYVHVYSVCCAVCSNFNGQLYSRQLHVTGTGGTKCGGNDAIRKFVNMIENSWLKRIFRMSDELYAQQVSNLRAKLSELLDVDGVLLMPTWSESACYKYQAVWKAYNVCYDYFVNAFGFASTAIPVGLDDNQMPLSLQQVIAGRDQDHLCLTVAEELENLFGGWVPPAPYSRNNDDDDDDDDDSAIYTDKISTNERGQPLPADIGHGAAETCQK